MEMSDGGGRLGLQAGDNRHCAYCHKAIRPRDVKMCAKCHRRSYCGRECQALDWKSKRTTATKGTRGFGQGHKDWCGLHVLAEGIEWDVVPIEGKGEGLVAKTLIPPLTRITVDERDLRDTARSTFTNHSCDANAHRTYDADYQVHILYSMREIQPGEEICTNYLAFTDTPLFYPTDPPTVCTIDTIEKGRRLLKTKWDIDCPSDCFCRREGLDDEVRKWKETYASIRVEVIKAKSKETAIIAQALEMDKVEFVLRGNEELKKNAVSKAFTLFTGFEVAARSKSTLDKGMEYLKECVDLWTALGHPNSKALKGEAEEYLEDPTSYDGYLCIDKKFGL